MDRALVDSAYRSYGSVVRRRARQILGAEEAAEEVVHDVFLSLMNDPSQFKGESSPLTWLYSATTHRCLNVLRDSKNRRRLLEREHNGESEPQATSTETSFHAREFFARLPDDLAQVAVYYYLDEMSQDEIADIMGQSRRHIASILDQVRALAERRQP